MIIRSTKQDKYTIIANHAANNVGLSLKAKGLFYYLITKPDNWNITREGIKSQISEGQRAIDGALKELEVAGYLVRTREKNANGQFAWVGTLHEKPLLRNATMENVTQVNTIETNTEIPITNVIEASPQNPDSSINIPRAENVGELGVDELPPIPPRPPQEYGNPDVNKVLKTFEEKFDLKLKRLPPQRFAAKRLITRYGLDKVLGGIHAAQIVRDEAYAPQILNIEDLWEKWDKLAAYYRKKHKQQESKVTIIED